MMRLSEQEAAFFNELFGEESVDLSDQSGNHKHQISIQSDIPNHIVRLFDKPSLTLLAEVDHYQLWFPLELDFTESGSLQPKLSDPEILDIGSSKRSWRVTRPEDVALVKKGECLNVTVESLSRTGMLLNKVPTSLLAKIENQKLTLHLPNNQQCEVIVGVCQQRNDFHVVMFKEFISGKTHLRHYLFVSHKYLFRGLYKSLGK